MNKVVVPIGEKIVVMNFGEFNDEINVDELTQINYSNLFGEAVTVSALMNRIGILKAEAEAILSQSNLDCEIYAAELSKRYRREANINSGKFTLQEGEKLATIKLTDSSLNAAILLDVSYQNKRKKVINDQKNLKFLESLYWSIQSKDKKLSVLMVGVTPKEFFEELLEGEVNAILIKKPKEVWKKKQ